MTIHLSNIYTSPKWPGVLERKIDIYEDGNYVNSSNAYTSLKNAIAGYKLCCEAKGLITAKFADKD